MAQGRERAADARERLATHSRVAHAAGDLVVRAGMEIGEATERVPSGAWVHTHNLHSDYIRTYDHRGGGR